MRHHGVDIDRAHALADRPLHAQQADAVLVLHQLADRTHPAVAEIVDVVDLPAAVLQLVEDLHRAQQVLLAQHAHRVGHVVEAQPHVHLHAADRRQVVAVRIEEQAAEQRLGGLRRRRFARAHHAVDVDQRIVAVGVLVHRQRVAHPGAGGLVHRERRQPDDTGLFQRRQLRLGELLAGLRPDLAGLGVHQVLGHETAEQIGAADQHLLGLLGDAPRLALRQLGFGVRHHLAGLGIDDRLQQLHATERVGIERPRPALRRVVEHHLAVEVVEDLLLIHAADLAQLQRLALRLAPGAQLRGGGAFQRIQQRGDRQLPLPVDADVDQVLAVELEVEPGAAIRDHPRGEQVLAGAVRLALVVVEEHAGRAVHLRDDDALGAIDDERAVVGHQRHVAHVDRLFLDVADRARAGVLVHVPHDQAQDDLQRRGIGHAALDALLDVVLGLFQLVIDELEPTAAGEVVDREHRLEHLLQAGMQPAVGADVHLQERLVRGALHVDQVRHRRHLGDPAEVAADPLAPGKRPADCVHKCPAYLPNLSPQREAGRKSV